MASDFVWIHGLARDNESRLSEPYWGCSFFGFGLLEVVVGYLVSANSFWELVEAHFLHTFEFVLSTKERHGSPVTVERARRVVA
mmetsp:Transcript_40612/g.98089  ORF Transcript_40612/g.98089 Transcript_40612/m.98089 type:complete len:84 (+) Transcript_40612:5255-5506(+)